MAAAELPDRVRAAVRSVPRLPCYLYDLPGLAAHAAVVRAATAGIELFYAAKANPDPRILAALAPYVDGFEVSSGGELAHLRAVLPAARLAFGGPGKTDEELALALDLGVHRVHVESPRELRRLAALRRETDILLRANLDLPVAGQLVMSGPFGMDPAALAECAELLPGLPWLRPRGLHTHLASGLAAPAMLDLADRILGWAVPWLAEHLPVAGEPELNLGGGMAVDYTAPGARFDWSGYGTGLTARAAPRLRLEPGRAITAYCGWYVTEVLDVKTTRGQTYAILRGGTHHLRTPVAKGHDQPFAVLPQAATSGTPRPVILVGQLCTPKDVFARAVQVPPLHPGDRIAFALAGAYAWNISHHQFLMHPKPSFHYISE